MTENMPVLTDSKTLNEVVNCLTENIPIQTQGKCEQQNIFEILIRAATQRDSIENTSKVLKNVPTSNDIRYHLDKYSDLASLDSSKNGIIHHYFLAIAEVFGLLMVASSRPRRSASDRLLLT
jgi:hypothetical protein